MKNVKTVTQAVMRKVAWKNMSFATAFVLDRETSTQPPTVYNSRKIKEQMILQASTQIMGAIQQINNGWIDVATVAIEHIIISAIVDL